MLKSFNKFRNNRKKHVYIYMHINNTIAIYSRDLLSLFLIKFKYIFELYVHRLCMYVVKTYFI